MVSCDVDRRLRRLGGRMGRIFLVAMDHGLPAGPLPGLERPAEFLQKLHDAPYSGVVANPGIVRHIASHLSPDRSLVVHLSGGTLLGPRPTAKVLTASVERAVGLGADAVSIQIHFGDPAEDRTLSDAGRVADAACGLGVPVLGMAHTSWTAGTPTSDSEAPVHAARAAAELGSDLVQVAYSGPPEGYHRIVRGCPVPVLVAGGPASPSEERWLDGLRGAFEAGVAGVAVGRLLFRAADPAALARRIAGVLWGDRPEPIPNPEGVR